ncbi:DUF1223 domain-containing protein [Hymenobacter sp. M29]|uniref:DUF1223 domain-containing protein n=1 Tax=Hymenobacter mellowenesis TaxID=3063995 RepID=A0ABT9A5G9_9BACT|nr:DUF1223 domain-containing protein [Hymenobacter sp. M29]MDO7845085.1 DUF1223 domain-containing protein [Hymenobacter sp. M29]
MARSLVILLPVLIVAAGLAESNTPAAGRVPVVVELFTSEGCSSCPAADAALRELETAQSVTGVEVIALGQHVDYWNRLGWKDPFSAPQFTERQRWYAQGFKTGSYTPQAVVNGRYEFVGNQRSTLAETVAKAAQVPRATVTLAASAPGMLRVSVGQLPAGTPAARVELALTETGLSSQVGRGENSGRLLRHAAVVRAWRTLGSVGADGTFTATAPLNLDAAWKTANLRAVVLVQETGSHHVVGVASLPLAAATSAAN